MSISEAELARIVGDIRKDRASIVKNNPLGSDEEILLWMLLGCLVNYLSLDETETPCFPGRPSADTYREAITFVLRNRTDGKFAIEPYLEKVIQK
jgi:hypothetical protein